MSNYYCPLVNLKGKPLALSEIRYRHLQQLSEVNEGYKVEYKSQWNSDVKGKLANIITSFANTEGGWLFIGVSDDGSVVNIDKPRTDYGQQISETVKKVASPLPHFSTKFICNPDDKSRGVLIIYIPEGDSPPYISTGTIYVRNGSSSTPIKADNRAIIDRLVDKRDKFRNKLDSFCASEIIDVTKGTPICVIYLFNRFPSDSQSTSYLEMDRKALAQEYGYGMWLQTPTSTLFMNSSSVAYNTISPTVEVYIDYSIKIYLPLPLLPSKIHRYIATELKRINPSIDIAIFSGVDGYVAYNMFQHELLNALEMIKKARGNLENYIIRISPKNIMWKYLYLHDQSQAWLQQMCKERFLYSPKEIPHMDLDRCKENQSDFIFQCTLFGLIMPFGMDAQWFLKLFNRVQHEAIETLGKSVFTNVEYYHAIYGYDTQKDTWLP